MTADSRLAPHGTAVRKDGSDGDFIVTFLDASDVPLESIRVTAREIAEAPPARMELLHAAVQLALQTRHGPVDANAAHEQPTEPTTDVLFDASVDSTTGDVLVSFRAANATETPEVVRVPRIRLEDSPIETRAPHIASRIASERARLGG
jgi:hypothetical protein